METELYKVMARPLRPAEVKGVQAELKSLYKETNFDAVVQTYELSCCFPKNEVIIANPSRDLYIWLRSKIRADDIVMQTNMGGGYTIVFSSRGKKRVIYGSVFSERAKWLRRRYNALWPMISPNNGKSFLFVVRGSTYYFLEPK